MDFLTPTALLIHVIADMADVLATRPGQSREDRSLRTEAITHMILGLGVRDVMGAMLAGHTVMFHTLMADSVSDTMRGETDSMRRSARLGLVAMNRSFHLNLEKLAAHQAVSPEAEERVDMPAAAARADVTDGAARVDLPGGAARVDLPGGAAAGAMSPASVAGPQRQTAADSMPSHIVPVTERNAAAVDSLDEPAFGGPRRTGEEPAWPKRHGETSGTTPMDSWSPPIGTEDFRETRAAASLQPPTAAAATPVEANASLNRAQRRKLRHHVKR